MLGDVTDRLILDIIRSKYPDIFNNAAEEAEKLFENKEAVRIAIRYARLKGVNMYDVLTNPQLLETARKYVKRRDLTFLVAINILLWCFIFLFLMFGGM